MGVLTLEIHDNEHGWLEAAELHFRNKDDVEICYDVDYASDFEKRLDNRALSLRYPVAFQPYRGPLPAFILDLIPQGDPLKKVLARYRIRKEDDYETILRTIPLASPGNVRVKQAWVTIESQRPSYQHAGFTADEIVQYQSDFIEYMQNHGALIGGTSGAGGGSPKFLLREDFSGRFHADGMLDDSKTRQAWLIKFPYTDSQNSIMLAVAEQAYYDLIRDLPLISGAAIELRGTVLFIRRFDREKVANRLLYHGLESFYSAHGLALHGAPLLHEENLMLIKKYSSQVEPDILEYIKRDCLNQILSNPDNHGRNISFIKKDRAVCLSPIYDVTSMKFFKSEPITRLTRWAPENGKLPARIGWISEQMNVPDVRIKDSLREFLDALLIGLPNLAKYGVPQELIDLSRPDRDSELLALQEALR